MCGQTPMFHLNRKRKKGQDPFTVVSLCGRSPEGSFWNGNLTVFKKCLAAYKKDIACGMSKSYISKPCSICLKKSGITA